MSNGALAGFPVVDIKATLYDGSYHDVDSSVLAFQIAARGAFREAMPKAGVRLLEPVMKVITCIGSGILMVAHELATGVDMDRAIGRTQGRVRKTHTILSAMCA